MPLGMYKPSQGYWVRVLTAAFFGVLALGTTMWAWSQAAGVDLPPRAYVYTTSLLEGGSSVGQAVELVHPAPDGSGIEILGTGIVQQYEEIASGSRARITVGDVIPNENIQNPEADDVTGATAVRNLATGNAQDQTLRTVVLSRQTLPIFPQLYLQGGVAVVVLGLSAVIVFYLVGVKTSTSEFLIATDGEMKKVNWSTRKEIIGSTQVVIFATFLLAAILFLIDFGFGSFFRAIGVLES